MKKIYHINYYVMLALLLITACKDDALKDEQIPVISIASPELDHKVWSDVTIKAEVTDDQQVSKVAFYVDDVLVEEISEAPYEISLDTRKYEDGKHILRCVAYDQAGNQAETLKEMEVFNKLFKVTVDDNHFKDADAQQEGWIIVSDTAGKVLQFSKLENGSEVILDRPDGFSDDEISVSLLEFTTFSSGNEFCFIDSYQGISPDEWTLEEGYSTVSSLETVGEASIEFSMPKGTYFISSLGAVRGNTSTINYSDYDDVTADLRLLNDKAKAYLGVIPNAGEPMYKFFDELQAYQYVVYDDEFKPLDLIKEITLPTHSYASITMDGIANPDDLSEGRFQVFLKSAGEGETTLPAYFPNSLFENYLSRLTISEGNTSYSHSSIGKLRDSYQIPTIDVEVVSEDVSNFQALSSYSADFSNSNWEYEDFSETLNILRWDVYTMSREGKVTFKAPEFPSEIVDQHAFIKDHIIDLKYQGTTFDNFDMISSLEEYVTNNYRLNTRSWENEYESVSVNAPSPDGGRIDKVMRGKLPENRMNRNKFW